MKALSGYKTLIVNALLLLATLFDWLVNNGATVSALFSSPAKGAATLSAIAAINAALRFITSTPVFTQKTAETAETAMQQEGKG